MLQPLRMVWWLISDMAENSGLLLCKCIIGTRKGGIKKIQETLDALYFVCRESFKESYARLRKADDPKSLLVDALYCEICANTISLCVELSCDLTNSPAMETSCRSILEAIILLRMVIKGEIDDEQIANFEKQSALLFYGNLFETAREKKDELFDDSEADAMKKKIDWIVADYERALEAYEKKYGEKLDERASREAIREGLFFTYKNPSKGKSFTALFNKHMLDVDPKGQMYKRISFFAHPWYLDNLDDLDLLRQERLKDVARCLEIAQELFSDELKVARKTDGAIESDLSALGIHLQRSQSIESVCSDLCQKATRPGSRIAYTSLCFAFLRDSLTEMNIMNGLGYPEMALSKFQSVAEFWSMNALLNNANGPKEFTALHRAFDYSTRVQVHNLGGFDKLGLKDERVLKEAFDSAFEKPSLPFEEYKANISKNSLLFLKGEPVQRAPSFLDMVRLGTEIAFPPEHLDKRKGFVLSYLFSIDVHHATGFCYTENRDCWLLLSHVGLRGIYQSVWVFAMLMALSSENPEVIPLCKALIELVNAETEEISNLNLKYPE